MYLINANTKVSEVIRMNKEAIDVLASINPHFEKLKNPLLRKILAPRVSLAEAAKIGKTTLEVFYQKLIPLGFNIENSVDDVPSLDYQNKSKYNDNDVVEFDVRPILKAGNDPFHEIINKLKLLQSGQTLCIINSFEPIPLIRIMEVKGYNVYTEQKDENLFCCWITPKKEINTVSFNGENSIKENFDELFERFNSSFVSINVRGLEMPQPMVSILEKIEQLKTGQALFVLHQRTPQYLLPVLNEKGFDWAIKEICEGEVEMIIYKK